MRGRSDYRVAKSLPADLFVPENGVFLIKSPYALLLVVP